MSNKTYDVLKWVAMIFLPAFITFYGAVSIAWGWPYTEQVLTTLGAAATMLGACLGISNANYKEDK